MNISIIGAGYVGLVTGACLAELGHNVILYSRNPDKVRDYKTGKPHIYEPGLSAMMNDNHARRRLDFTADFKEAVDFGQAIYISVGTPPRQDGSADLSAVFETAKCIGQAMTGPKLVVVKSTVPVGTTHHVGDLIHRELAAAGKPTDWRLVANNPEFLREGTAVQDFLKPDRVVIGVDSASAEAAAGEIYQSLAKQGHPVLIMDILSSEMTKYAANSMLASKISFINEIANICEHVGADVSKVREGMCLDSRIGFSFLSPGVGYGGSCFPKDVKALIALSADKGYTASLLQAVEGVNHNQREIMADKIIDRLSNSGKLTGATAAVWGLAFKPDTDDIREAPALIIIRKLLERGIKVKAHDPQAGVNAMRAFVGNDSFSLVEKPYDALDGADCLAVITEWPDYRNPDFTKIKDKLRRPLIFDGRNLYSRSQMARLGFSYISIGRPDVGD